MNERTHVWIATRAVALLEDSNKAPNLLKILKPEVRSASIGAWIPDQIDAKRGGAGSSTDNHILKMLPYKGNQTARFTTPKAELIKHLGTHRLTSKVLEEDATLSAAWWKMPYKGDVPKPGQHLPNRCMALSTVLKDLLLMGNEVVDALLPGSVRFLKLMDPEARSSEEELALFFFMLSHFIADSSMPCHCDGRLLAGYDKGLHKELEKHWSQIVGSYFERKNLLKDSPATTPEQILAETDAILSQSREVDKQFNISFPDASIPELVAGHDIWLEMTFLCRASFALSCIIAPPDRYPYEDTKAVAPFEQVLEGPGKTSLLAALDQAIMHDAVLNTAIVWKHVWEDMSA